MQNVRKECDIRLKNTWKSARKLISKPNFKKCTIFDEQLVAIEMNRTSIFMRQPVAIGFSVLELAKECIYSFLYDHIKVKYGSKATAVYVDTDAFLLNVYCDSFYADMKENLDRYDTSDFPENNIFEMPRVNKKIPGLMKDELNGEVLKSFIGLRAKMYVMKTEKSENKIRKAKGIKKCVVKKQITYNDYLNCVLNNCTLSKKQSTFRSKLQNMYTIEQNKIALSPFDDKRVTLSNNIDTLPYGHYLLQQKK